MKPPPFRGLSRCERLEADMRYRDVDYTLVQGQGGQLWKWSFALHNKPHTGEAGTKAEAVSQAERAIDRALVFGKLSVIRQKLEG
jgi:hypothetical protein